jgi:hypothetical protein
MFLMSDTSKVVSVKHAMIGISEEIKHDADISYCL